MDFRSNDRNQQVFFGYSLSDFVPTNSFPAFVVQFVSQLNIDPLIESYSRDGSKAYDPRIMLSIWFLAFSRGITSTRRIEYECKNNMEFIYASTNLKPDHTTLYRFRALADKMMPELFAVVVKNIVQKTNFKFDSIAIDGTKMRSRSSWRKSHTEKDIEAMLAKVREDITEYLTEVDKDEQKFERLKKRESSLEEARQKIVKRKQTIEKDHKKTHKINLVEEDAYTMRFPSGRDAFPGYNAIVSTCTKTQLIVVAEVTQRRSDHGEFSRQHKSIERVIGSDKSRRYIVDSGFYTRDEANYALENGINLYFPEIWHYGRSENEIGKKQMHYEEVRNLFVCPEGKELRPKRHDGDFVEYVTRECKNCTIREKCTSSRDGGKYFKKVVRHKREKEFEALVLRGKTVEGKKMIDLRQRTVEPVIGNLKSNLGFNRFTRFGLNKVNADFAFMCIGHNLRKLYQMALRGEFPFPGGFFDRFIFLFSKILCENRLHWKITQKLTIRQLIFGF